MTSVTGSTPQCCSDNKAANVVHSFETQDNDFACSLIHHFVSKMAVKSEKY